jgi:hypothetical protein
MGGSATHFLCENKYKIFDETQMSLKYKITTAYCYYNKKSMIVKMYFMNEVPFTFDELPELAIHDPDLIELADMQTRFEPEDLYKSSDYLISEEAHPCFFPVELVNPEDLPDDLEFQFDEEDLAS